VLQCRPGFEPECLAEAEYRAAGRGEISGEGSVVLEAGTALPPLHELTFARQAFRQIASLTDLPTGADGQNLYVINDLGYPDFWGRYLTNTVCPAISSVEIAAAVHWHMGILPIYNDYDCSAVVGYTAGSAYAAAASAAAAGLHIPAGRGLAVDIEPPGAYCPGAGNVDAGFIDGWFDGITAAGYAPVYYGNGTAGSEFGTAWCTAVSQRPEIAAFSYLWSFEPSLSMNRMRLNAPAFSPYQPGCTANVAAWQYTLSAGSDPDVDVDEALSTLPIWFP
jgi:hypothetical protein